MDTFISHIIKTKQTCVFVSPHLDDAVLSAGGLIDILSKKTKVIVVNVFTKSDDTKQTLSAKVFVKGLGYTKASELFKERIAEDKRALAMFGITPINLGYHDVLWRKKHSFVANTLGAIVPEFAHIYPTYRFHVAKGQIAQADKPTMTAISKELQAIVAKERAPLIFCPIGIGNHVDHRIVREICKNAFSQVIFWSDFPYNVRENNFGESPASYTKQEYPIDIQRKRALIEIYKTQTPGLFSHGIIPEHKEVYFIVKETKKL